MSIFSVKAGERVSITTETVNVEFGESGAKGMLKTNVSYWATATDRFQDYGGERRRLFVDMSEDFGLGREIWLTDGPSVYRTPVVENKWPDLIGDD